MNDSTWGSALQAGVDIPVSRNMYLNFDVKKILVKTPVNYQGNSIGTLKVDPLLISVGLDWRFY
jgi:outer membrane protein